MAFNVEEAYRAYNNREFDRLMSMCSSLSEMRLDASALLWLTRLNTGMSNVMIDNACAHLNSSRMSFDRATACSLLECTISEDSIVESNVWLEGVNEFKRAYIQSGTRFGLFSYVAHGSFVGVGTEMGRYCSVGMNSTIGPGEHTIDWISTHNFALNRPNVDRANQSRYENQSLKIGHDVWIGANALIKTNVNVGHGAVIGGGSVVVKDVDPYTIVVGNPARLLRRRFTEDATRRLLRSEWWRLPIDYVKKIPFHDVEKALDTIEDFRLSLPESSLI